MLVWSMGELEGIGRPADLGAATAVTATPHAWTVPHRLRR